jgi:hypothetical protein
MAWRFAKVNRGATLMVASLSLSLRIDGGELDAVEATRRWRRGDPSRAVIRA